MRALIVNLRCVIECALKFDPMLVSNLLDLEYVYNLFVQLPAARICNQMLSDFSGADEMLNGCHSFLAIEGMFTNM